MANIVTTLPSPGNPSRIIDRDTGEEVSPAFVQLNPVTGGFEPVSQEAANIINKVGPSGPTVTSLNPPQQVAQPQPQPQQVAQPVSQAENIQEKMEQTAGVAPGVTPALPAGTAINPTDIPTDSSTEQQQRPDLAPVGIQTALVQQGAELDVTPPLKTAAEKYTADVIPGTPEAVAATGKLSSEAVVGDIQGAVSQRAVAQAATGELDERATVRYQIGELFKSFEEGREPPAWASPAIRAVTAQMQARGLGASSMAAAAITQAITEAGIPIAKADADKYSQVQLVNLNNQQQAVLQNAATFAAMDKANLDSRLQGAVNNARAFLTLDTQNLNNDQKIREIDYSGKLQSLFKDQAATNAARQFNAESQTQVDQFYDQLSSSIESANVNRRSTQEQFNVSSMNAMAQYITSLNADRDQFNRNLAQQIDQSNVLWRRQTTTANTQADNEAERINAQNLLNISQQAQNQLWQKYRDDAAWTLQYANTREERAHQFALMAAEQSGNVSLFEKERRYDAIGSLAKGALYKVIFK